MKKNGLRSFSLHANDESAADAMLAAAPSFGVAGPASTLAGKLEDLDPESAARLYLDQALASPEIPSLTAPAVNGAGGRFRSLGTESLLFTGTKMVKFRQQYRRVPVYGSLVSVELDDKNQLLAIQSNLGEPHNVEAVAKIAPADAIKAVRERAGYGHNRLDAEAQLHYFFDAAGDRWRLAYIIENVRRRGLPSGRLPEIYDYVVDAHSGEIVEEIPRTQTTHQTEQVTDALGQPRTITYIKEPNVAGRLFDPTRNVHTHDFAFHDIDAEEALLPGAYVVNPPVWPAPAVSAHANASDIQDFLVEVLKRNGLDNQGNAIASSINCVSASQPGNQAKEWRNAAWIPDRKMMVYGQRIVGNELISYAIAKDVVAHEVFHGVTDHTARLEYRFMSGALNESYSDIFGILIDNRHENDIAKWDWKLGEDLSESGVPLRSLEDPAAHSQPAHMRDYRQLPIFVDHGGVHVNSGIHNKAAHLIMTAKASTGDHLFTAVELARVFYVALTQFLSRTSTFSDSRRGVELAARTLFRRDPVATRRAKIAAVRAGFDAVGIDS